MEEKSIRPTAIALMIWENKILVLEYIDKITQQHYYRPLGGGIKFGEYGRQTIKREIKEEIGAKIYDVQYLFALENIFVCDGKPDHQIILVFDAKLEDTSLYGKILEAIEDNGEKFPAFWKSLHEIEQEGKPLYPDGLPEILQELFHQGSNQY